MKTVAAFSLVCLLGACSKPSGDPLPSASADKKPMSASASPARDAAPASSVPHSPGGEIQMDLPRAHTATPTAKGLPLLAVNQKEMRLVGSKEEPLKMPPPIEWYAGMPLSMKGNQQGYLLLPVQDWLKAAKKGNEHDLSLVAEKAISYRIITEMLYTAGTVGYDQIHFVVLTPEDSYGEMLVDMPAMYRDAGVQAPAATVVVVDEGISVKIGSANVGPACANFGAGLAFPRINGLLDTTRIASCLDRMLPEAGAAQLVVVGAPPRAEFGDVATVIDAVRSRKGKTTVRLGTQH